MLTFEALRVSPEFEELVAHARRAELHELEIEAAHAQHELVPLLGKNTLDPREVVVRERLLGRVRNLRSRIHNLRRDLGPC